MDQVLIWAQLSLSLLLIVAILVHPAKGMGLGSMGGSAEIFGSQKGAESGLNKITAFIVIMWALVALLRSSNFIV